MVDEDRIRRVLNRIEDHPDEWNQDTYVSDCGTTFCFAGHTLIDAGYEVKFDYSNWEMRFVRPDFHSTLVDSPFLEAERLLGLDLYQADRIFHFYTDDLDALRSRVMQVTGVNVVCMAEVGSE